MISASLRKFAAFVVVVSPLFIANTSPVLAQATITLSDPNCVSFALGGTAPNQTLTCVTSTTTPTPPPTPGAPTGCVASISASPTTSAGGTVTVGVSGCSPGPVTYWWHKDGLAWNIGPTDTLPANLLTTAVTTTYSVTACNSTGCTIVAPVTATVPGAGSTGGTIGGTSCPGYSKTMFYNWNWANGGFSIDTYSASQGPIGPNGIVVIAFTPQATAPLSSTGDISIAPYPAPLDSTTRRTSISTTPCDFSLPYPWTHTGSDAGGTFTVGTFIPDLYTPLTAGQTYYINITSRDLQNVSTCSGSGYACDMRVQVSRPR